MLRIIILVNELGDYYTMPNKIMVMKRLLMLIMVEVIQL